VARPAWIEHATRCLEGSCSGRLSYGRNRLLFARECPGRQAGFRAGAAALAPGGMPSFPVSGTPAAWDGPLALGNSWGHGPWALPKAGMNSGLWPSAWLVPINGCSKKGHPPQICRHRWSRTVIPLHPRERNFRRSTPGPCVLGGRVHERQRRASIPAWGNAPGLRPRIERGLKARPIADSDRIGVGAQQRPGNQESGGDPGCSEEDEA
jgi:hypothetical protein